jgi:hypothetical protein
VHQGQGRIVVAAPVQEQGDAGQVRVHALAS